VSLNSDTAERSSGHLCEDITRVDGDGVRDEVCGALCEVLREGVDIHRCLAAQALGRIDSSVAVGTLVAALLDEDEDVRTDAAGALARLLPREAEKQLLDNLLGDPCTGVKLNAIDALTHMRSPEVVPWLHRLVRGRDEGINWDEAEFFEGGWDDWLDIQVKAIEALTALGVEQAVLDVVGAIDDEDGQDLAEVGFKALGALGIPGIEALERYLADGAPRRRRRAATVLAACDAPAAQAAAGRALQDPSADVRLATARVLAAKHPADTRLAALFADPDPDVRAEIVRLCGCAFPEHLAARLGDPSPAVSRAVLECLAERPDVVPYEEVADAIRPFLCSSEPGCAAAGALALAAVAGEAALDALTEQLTDAARPIEVRLAAVKGLARISGVAATQALAEVMSDDTRQLRLEAMAALAAGAAAEEHWPNPPGEVLLAALRGELVTAPDAEAEAERPAVARETVSEEDRDPADEHDGAPAEDGAAVADGSFPKSTLQSILGGDAPPLAESEGEETPVALTQKDLDRLALAARTPRKRVVPITPEVVPHEDVRQFAARVLGDLPRNEVASALACALDEGAGDLRLIAADSLARVAERMGAVPDEVTDVLLRGLIDAERDIRLAAIRALGATGGQGTARVLRDQLGDEDSFIRAEAVRALARLGPVGGEVVASLRDPDPGVRLAAAQAVAQFGGADAVDPLVDYAFAFEGYHRREAGRLLRGLDAAAASRRFLETLGNPDRIRVWPVAIEALEELNRRDAATANGPRPQSIEQEGAPAS
jgi:HEAT repeat protein